LKKIAPVISTYEQKKREEIVAELIEKAIKNELAVVGLDNVLNALQEQRVMRLIIEKDFKANGYGCISCGYLTPQEIQSCPFCKGRMEPIDSLIGMAGEKAIHCGDGFLHHPINGHEAHFLPSLLNRR
jgi:peptide subunit release factor 1 (eRF1)